MLDIVVDTSILVAAFRSSLGASHELLQRLETRMWRPVVSPALALEYESVLKRYAAEVGFGLSDIDDFMEYFFSRARLVRIHFRWRPILPDANDDRILEVAVRAGAPIVTFNRKDFRGSEVFGIRVMGPKEFLLAMGGNQ